jgi:hypothetical protein
MGDRRETSGMNDRVRTRVRPLTFDENRAEVLRLIAEIERADGTDQPKKEPAGGGHLDGPRMAAARTG